MNALPAIAPAPDALRQHLESLLSTQRPHAVYPCLGIDWEQPYDITQCTAVVGGVAQVMSVARLLKLIEDRDLTMRREAADPYRYGFEPEVWRETDWDLAALRCAFPGQPITMAVLGGNGSSKTWYAAKRLAWAMHENENWLCWQFAEEEKTSREVPQQWTYASLPEELRPDTGKHKKNARTKMTYNAVNGFTDNSFGLDNRSRCNFIFYNSNIKALEGPRPNFCWADELIPVEFMSTCRDRLLTKAGNTTAIVPALAHAIAQRDAGDPDAWEKYLRPLIPRLMEGVLLITFTPKYGYTPTVAKLEGKSVIKKAVPAELLPTPTGFESVPRLRWNAEEKAIIRYFHVYDNPFGGNWQAMKSVLAKEGRAVKLWKAYGVAVKTIGVQFPLFSREAHVREISWLPKTGTWYHIADPVAGRNWFMIWAKVCPQPGGEDLIFVAREWPQPGDWIEANQIGDPGEWAENGNGKKADGVPGPAQLCWGLGYQQIADEIARVEKELYQLEQKMAGDAGWATAEGRITLHDGCRIMDGRAGNTETTTHGESLTLIQIMSGKYGLDFAPAGRDSGAEQGKTTIREGVGMITDRLNYDSALATLQPSGVLAFGGKSPSLIIADRCANLIDAMAHWTGRDGGEGARKDPIDCIRYLTIANPRHYDPTDLYARGGGSY